MSERSRYSIHPIADHGGGGGYAVHDARQGGALIYASTDHDECETFIAETEERDRMLDDMPTEIGLCPKCKDEFWYPLSEPERDQWLAGEPVTCPMGECDQTLIIYPRERD